MKEQIPLNFQSKQLTGESPGGSSRFLPCTARVKYTTAKDFLRFLPPYPHSSTFEEEQIFKFRSLNLFNSRDNCRFKVLVVGWLDHWTVLFSTSE